MSLSKSVLALSLALVGCTQSNGAQLASEVTATEEKSFVSEVVCLTGTAAHTSGSKEYLLVHKTVDQSTGLGVRFSVLNTFDNEANCMDAKSSPNLAEDLLIGPFETSSRNSCFREAGNKHSAIFELNVTRNKDTGIALWLQPVNEFDDASLCKHLD